MALGAQRLLPTLQQGYTAWSVVASSEASLKDVIELLDQPMPAYANQPAQIPIQYRQHILIRNVSFRYAPSSQCVLRNVNLTIARGARIGFIGATGSGKSTLIDIIMGLLPPSEGELSIDGQTVNSINHRAWQAHIAHVPQSIYLADISVAENIAFGLPVDKIDIERVRQAAKQAQIDEVIESWPNKYQTFVGERGVRLSGGQRQRVGIARALYKKADVIVFDEATSALDNETEKAVMDAIDSLNLELTIIIVAHRLTTLQKCSQIIELGNGGILRTGTYQDLVGTHTLTH
jgi:ATP-binding cassette subfamily B protein